MGNRYFLTTAMGGRLYVDDGFALCEEAMVEMFANPRMDHRKARTIKDLLEVVRESGRGLPAIRVWVSEGLEGEARKLWEETAGSARTK